MMTLRLNKRQGRSPLYVGKLLWQKVEVLPSQREDPDPATAGIWHIDFNPLLNRLFEAIDLRFELLDNLRVVEG